MRRCTAMASMALLTMGVRVAAAGSITIDYPYIDVVQQNSDLGASDTGGALTIQATADAIFVAPGSSMSIAPAGTFTLNATYEQPDLTSGDYDFNNGTLSVINGGSTPLLTATFSNLVLETGVGTTVFFTAPLTYTGGSLAGDLSGGELLGSFLLSSGTTNLSQDFTGATLTAKAGAVVPPPGSLLLLLGGLGGLTAFGARRPIRPVP